jgi:serine/threonine-protein kinase
MYGSFVIVDTLGRGGYASVYRARRDDLEVALKVLDDARNRVEVARLRHEFETARRLDHPHIVKMYVSGTGWLAMELIDGGSIETVQPLSKRLVALSQIASALDYAHNHGVVHCDVKPTNILVSRDISRAVLIDFGIAHTIADDIGHRPRLVEASLPYSAPELITNHAPTEATDEYALACTAVELITGSPPFTAPTAIGLIEAHLHQPPPRRSGEIDWLPRVFDAIVAKALAKSPTDRYASCREFVALLKRAFR